MPIKNPLIIGLGNVGGLMAVMLAAIGMNVTTMDQRKPASMPKGVKFISGDVTDRAALLHILKNHDAVISCLPFNLTINVAQAAHKAGVFYFDPTEDVKTTEAIKKLAKTAKRAMAPQCGLAPGLIGIIGAHMASKFDEGSLRYIKMRVGALPQSPTGMLGYAGNWSLAGLVHEYIAYCDVIINGRRQKVLPLHNHEILRIDGMEYEAFTTSGGLGTMTETYNGKVETLDYKSIRYPGHLDCMKVLLEDLRFRDDPDALVQRLAYALPPDDDDRVLIHASVQGKIKGGLRTKTFVAECDPVVIGGKLRPAILWTTAASIVAVVEMVSCGLLPQKGFIRQESIPLPAYLKTHGGAYFAANCPKIGVL